MRPALIINDLRVLLFAVCVLLLGCNKEVVVEQGDVDVSFTVDWSAIKSGCHAPSGASIYLYPIAGGEPILVKSVATKTNMTVPEGRYKIVMHNEDLVNIHLRNSNVCEGFEGYVEPQVYRRTKADQMVIPQADYLHLLLNAADKEINVIKGVPLNLTLYPATATYTYRFKIKIESPILYSAATAIMTGIATRINILTAKLSSENISQIEVPLTIGDKKIVTQILEGSVEVLGVDPANQTPGTNNMHIVLTPAPGSGASQDVVLDYDMTSELIGFANKNLDIDVIVKAEPGPGPDPDPENKLVIFEVIITPWDVKPPVDLDIVVTE